MAEGVIDLKRELRESKAHEQLAGFTGFSLDLGLGGTAKDGVLKIAVFTRPDNSGYITLTFQTDPDPEPPKRAALAGVFERFSHVVQKTDALTGQARFGRGFEYLMLVSEGLVDGDRWFVVELDIYYKDLRDRVRALVEAAVLPGLSALMPVTFEPVNWWD